jgi:hypothetical protein
MCGNGYVYEMLRVCVRGFSEGKSDASKQSNSHWLSTKQQFFIYNVVKRFYILNISIVSIQKISDSKN